MIEAHSYSNDSSDALYGEFAPHQKQDIHDPQVLLAGHVLASTVQLQSAEQAAANDSALLMDLPGSYGAAVHQENTLSLLTDVAGQFPWFYSQIGITTYYSTSATRLAKQVGTQPDRYALGNFIFNNGGSGLNPSHTAFENVKRVPPGSMFQASKNRVSLCEYDSLAPDPTADYDEAVIRVRESLLRAVALRQKYCERIGGDFSGGFDSTSLGFIAARNATTTRPFDGFHYQNEKAPSGDSEYATYFASLDPRIRLHHRTVRGEDLPFDQLDPSEIIRADLPLHFDCGSPILTEELRAIAKHGITDHMVGEGGDALFTPHWSYMADMIRQFPAGSMKYLTRSLLGTAQRRHVSPWAFYNELRNLAQTSLQDSYYNLAQMLEHPTKGHRSSWHSFTVEAMPLLHPKLRKELAEIAYDKASTSQPSVHIGMADYRSRDELRASDIIAMSRRIAARQFGIEVHTPYMDTEVVRACFQLEAFRRSRPGQFKPLLSDALRGVVSSPVFDRKSKGHYTQEQILGMARNDQRLIKLLGKDSLLSQLQIIDPEAMAEAIRTIRLGSRGQPLSIAYAASAELWLRQIHGYNQPAAEYQPAVRTIPTSAAKLPDVVQKRLHVPDHTRFAEDSVAVVAYNLLTGQQRVLSPKAELVVKALQQHGNLEDVYNALEHHYPDVDPAFIAHDLEVVIAGLESHGSLQPGEYRAFSIPKLKGTAPEKAAEVFVAREAIDRTGVVMSDYVRMGRSLLSATKITSSAGYTLYDTLRLLQDTKIGLPYSTPDRVHNLLTAGHVLNRYIGKAACLELSIAATLAEARQGRRVDISIGMGLFPRQYHAWPSISGAPVQTAFDERIDGRFVAFGEW